MEEKQLPESSYIENKGIGARVICQEFFEFYADPPWENL